MIFKSFFWFKAKFCCFVRQKRPFLPPRRPALLKHTFLSLSLWEKKGGESVSLSLDPTTFNQKLLLLLLPSGKGKKKLTRV